MAFGVTPEGFKAKRFPEIIKDIGNSLQTELGIDINSDPDSVAKVITNIIANALADEWALPQALQAMFDIDKAEGVHLDNLVRLIGLTRLTESQSNGRQYITSTQTLNIPIGSQFSDAAGNSYLNKEEISVGLTSCVDTLLSISPTAGVGQNIAVNINGTLSEVTIVSDIPTAVTALVDDINLKTVLTNVSAEDKTVGTDYEIQLSNTSDLVSSNIILNTNLVLEEVTSFGFVFRENFGQIEVPINTVIIAPAITGITSTTNRYPYTVGRLTETDEDLRNRYKVSLSFAGTATVDAIRADILQLAGVVDVEVKENITFITDTDGIPPKAFLCVVKGGDEQDIGNSIWENKPAGIESHGEINVIVIDNEGNEQVVKFSRSTPRYIHVKVEYTLYEEQKDQFPANGEDLIIDTVLSYGNSLLVGEDVIPQRFSSEIFQQVGGLAVVNVLIGETPNSTDPTPPLSPNIIPISSLSEADFNSLRITTEEV